MPPMEARYKSIRTRRRIRKNNNKGGVDFFKESQMKNFDSEKENPRESIGYKRPQPPDAEKVIERVKQRGRAQRPSPLLEEYMRKQRGQK